jgi:hypothetical protein
MLKNILKIKGVQELSITEQKNVSGSGIWPPPPKLISCLDRLGATCKTYGSLCREAMCITRPVFTNG